MDVSALADRFSPFSDWARLLLPETGAEDPAHDPAHLVRVFANVTAIARGEGGDLELLCVATLLHDCVHVEKNSPLRARASRLAAERARVLLADRMDPDRIERIAHAIEAHSFSAGIEPKTLEARILQDADRLDAIGAVGIARCFSVSGRLGRGLYDVIDPRAKERDLDDLSFTIDHFHTKLLHLSQGFKTQAGARIAAERHARLERFLAEFYEEIGAGAA